MVVYELICPACKHASRSSFVRVGAVVDCAGCHKRYAINAELVRRQVNHAGSDAFFRLLNEPPPNTPQVPAVSSDTAPAAATIPANLVASAQAPHTTGAGSDPAPASSDSPADVAASSAAADGCDDPPASSEPLQPNGNTSARSIGPSPAPAAGKQWTMGRLARGALVAAVLLAVVVASYLLRGDGEEPTPSADGHESAQDVQSPAENALADLD